MWSWLGFFVGAAVGWIAGWLFEMFFGRRREMAVLREKEALRVRLDQAQAQIKTMEGKQAEPETSLQVPSAGSAVGQPIPVPTDVVADFAMPAFALPGSDLMDPRALSAELPIAAPIQPDDLVKIEGIGPKIAQVLKDSGVLTFAQLAAVSPEHLSSVLREAGPRFRLADPASWPDQARLAANGAWEELQALQKTLIAGRKAPPAGP